MTAPRKSYDVLVVGAGHGGAQLATALRQRNFAGTIGLLSDEPEFPYERPPLSKDYLAGNKAFDQILIRPAAYWASRDIQLLTSRRVVAVDPAAHTVTTADDETFGYGQLVWAAGGRARRLTCSGHDLVGVHSLRNRGDVDRMKAELGTVSRVAIVGGGYIGLEAAAALIKLGLNVTVLEAQDRVLARVAGRVLARFYEAEHRAHGVVVRLDTVVECIEEREGRAGGVRLAGGEVIPAGMVVVGIGIVPAVEPLEAAGAACGDGVAVDEHGRTTLPDVWAIGDCAMHSNAFAGHRQTRLESVQNANDMATTVAAAISGSFAPYHAVPWFWSNQYDLRLQTIGLSTGYDSTVTRGDPVSRSFSVIYLKGGRVIALDCVNATRDFIQGKRLVEGGLAIDPARLATMAIPLKEMTTLVRV